MKDLRIRSFLPTDVVRLDRALEQVRAEVVLAHLDGQPHELRLALHDRSYAAWVWSAECRRQHGLPPLP